MVRLLNQMDGKTNMKMELNMKSRNEKKKIEM